MFCTRNLIKIVNISKSQPINALNQHKLWKSMHISSSLTQQMKNHQATSDEFRVYYGKFHDCVSFLINLLIFNSLCLGSLTPNIKSVKVFSLTTSIVGIIAQPILYNQAAQMSTSTPVIAAICGFVGFFTFVTPFLLHVVTRRYVTELYYNPKTDEYNATTISFFLTKKKTIFKPEDVVVPEVTGMFTSFVVKNKSGKKPAALFVDPKLFEDPQHYVKIMGYDKPLDLKLDLSEKK
ncbi:CLUMA_CG008932, isoform A [Clunio marinus]|uniref:CLUMA_CG008932, isoform A n=1 Tax=Clunio marinus TaxID=568069 RepID=A0A1J1I545_9DIPT|nr:CLUMA_CG008932, isoform A [Clunio marinus]